MPAIGRLEGLSRDQNLSWTTFLRMEELLRARIERRLAEHSGLSFADYSVLVVLAGARDRRMRLTELGAAMGWDRSRLHHQLTRMTKRGLVERGPMPEAGDARASQAVLTSAGLAAIRAASRRHAKDVRELVVDVLSDAQLRQLGELSKIILDGLEGEPSEDG